MSEPILYPYWQETLIVCSVWRIPHKPILTCWTHCLPIHYTVPQFENHDRWKVKRFFQCLTQNDRPQTSSILSPGSAWLLWSRDSSAGQSCSDTVWLMRGPSPWQTAPYRPAFTVCLYEFVCVLLIKWDYNLSLTGRRDVRGLLW